MNIPLYARMSEFAPAPSAQKAEGGHEGQDEEQHEDVSPHGTLFEQCTPEFGKAKAGAGDTLPACGDAAQRAELTADVPDLKIGSALAEGNLTDGYKLHDVGLFDSGEKDKSALNFGVAEVAARNFEPSAAEKSNVVPTLELDFSADVASANVA